VGLSHREAVSSATGFIFIRVYVFSDDTLLHLGKEFDVKRLYEASLLMADRVLKNLARSPTTPAVAVELI
jgi:hypothetical protein